MRGLFNPAGGLRYHLRALAYRHFLWAPYLRSLATWLAEWLPGAGPLLLVGPSAGWCLPDAFLMRFTEIDVLEPDPLARLLLRRRLHRLGCRNRAHVADYLAPETTRAAALARDFPSHAILFCNVLGQLGGLDPAIAEDAHERWTRELANELRGHHWATFHDRLSGPLAPAITTTRPAVATSPSDDELVDRFYRRRTGPVVALQSHGTSAVLPEHPRSFLAWHLRPGYHHLIEAIRHAPE